MTSTPTPTPTLAPALMQATQCAAVARSAHTRRCLTLLEILIALVLLLGLMAIGLPMMLNRLDERAFEAAADAASEQLMMARAHAQATGEAIEVTYSPTTGQVNARVYAPWSSEMDTDLAAIEPGTSPLLDASLHSAGSLGSGDSWASGSSNRDQSRSEMYAKSGAAAGAGAPIAEPWASRVLGRGISIARRPSSSSSSPGFPFASADDEGAGDGGSSADWFSAARRGDDDSETLEDLERGQEVRLAVFMPDGSALVGDDLFLNDDKGRCGRISINPWSGLPMFQRIVNGGHVGQPAADENDASLASDRDSDRERDRLSSSDDDDLWREASESEDD